MSREIPESLKGLDVIVQERLRQVEDLGYTVQHDAGEHDEAELLRIGTCYADWATTQAEGIDPFEQFGESHPFWSADTSVPWKPEKTAPENAAKAGAFMAAALDLLYAKMMGEV